MREKLMKHAGKFYTSYFLITAIISLTSFLIMYGGQRFLLSRDLQWRNWVFRILVLVWELSVILFIIGIPILIICKIRGSWKIRLPVIIISVALIIGIFIISFYVLFLTLIYFNTSESIVIWNGQKCVREDFYWADTAHSWYSYHGRFVMGRERLHYEVIS